MAASSGSRFGVLKVEGDDDDYIGVDDRKKLRQQQKAQGKPDKKAGSHGDAAKKNRPPPQGGGQDKELQKLAFGKPQSAKSKKQVKAPAAAVAGAAVAEPRLDKDEQWHEWQEHDVESAKSSFEKDLRAAVEESLRLEAEKKAQKLLSEDASRADKVDQQKKVKPSKPHPMSLAEFSRVVEGDASKQLSSDVTAVIADVPEHRAHGRVLREPPGLETHDFFEKMNETADSVIRKAEIQDEYSKQYAVHNAIAGNYLSIIEGKDAEIAKLQKEVESLQAELQQVKNRNHKLCSILAAAEMSEKAQLVKQLEQAVSEKDELTKQVTSVIAELEKERSAANSRKPEAEKRKGKPKA